MTYNSKGAKLLRAVLARRNLKPCWTPAKGWHNPKGGK